MFEDNATQLVLFTVAGGSAVDVDAVDVDDTAGCLLGEACEACEACGQTGPALRVCTAGTPFGVYCLGLCGACVGADRVPRPSTWGAAARCVAQHCEHLGITGEQMTHALETGQTGGGER